MLKRWIELHTEKTAWLIDTEFLLSNYQCNWGNGCKGIDTKSPDLGCCANGAFLEDSDVELLKKRVQQLTPDVWQNYGSEYLEKVVERNKIGIKKNVEYKTAIVDKKNPTSGCVFANRSGFSGGTGCALHISALKRGENPLDWKPNICWQMPLIVEFVEELNTHIIRMFWWGEQDYDWFCAREDKNWVGDKPVFKTMSQELEKMISAYDETAYPKIKQLLNMIWEQSEKQPNRKRIPVTLVYN